MSKTTTKSSVNCNRACWHLKISLSIIFSCLVQPTTIICSLGFKLKNFPKLSLFLVDFISHNLGLLVKGSHLNIRGGNVFFRVIFEQFVCSYLVLSNWIPPQYQVSSRWAQLRQLREKILGNRNLPRKVTLNMRDYARIRKFPNIIFIGHIKTMKRAKIGQGKYCDIFLTWDGCPGCPVWTAQSPATGAPPCWAKDQRAVNYFFLSASKTVQRQPSARECNHVIVQVQTSCCIVPIRKRQAFSFLGTKPGGATFCKRRAVSTRYTLLEKYVLNVF